MTSPRAVKHVGMVFFVSFSSNLADFCEECCTFGLEKKTINGIFLTIRTSIPTHEAQPHYHGDFSGGFRVPIYYYI